MGDMESEQYLARGRAGGQFWNEERQEQMHRRLRRKGPAIR